MSENQKNQELETEAPEAVEEVAEEASAEPTEEEVSDGKLKGADKKRLKKAEAELAEVKKKLEATEAALAEEKDKYLRMLAEYDNFRRRTAKEKETIYGDATAETVKGLLPVVDTLERAAAGLTPEDAESPLGKGITMTLKSATDALAKLGVEEVPCDVFNPDIHNAVMHVEDDSLPEGAIVAVFQKGYRKGDHIIRYAMVQVAN
ncbi:MAG: nucleotide exchange factor GrpE [Ruminococcaceae bacterium]|nr:nucleotide exchange factor GrpE [Oscillospiraceae bacterium]